MQTIKQQSCMKCGEIYLFTPSNLCYCDRCTENREIVEKHKKQLEIKMEDKNRICGNCLNWIHGMGCNFELETDANYVCDSWEYEND